MIHNSLVWVYRSIVGSRVKSSTRNLGRYRRGTDRLPVVVGAVINTRPLIVASHRPGTHRAELKGPTTVASGISVGATALTGSASRAAEEERTHDWQARGENAGGRLGEDQDQAGNLMVQGVCIAGADLEDRNADDGDDDRQRTQNENARGGDLALQRHLQPPDCGDGENQDPKVGDDVKTIHDQSRREADPTELLCARYGPEGGDGIALRKRDDVKAGQDSAKPDHVDPPRDLENLEAPAENAEVEEEDRSFDAAV